ncbi:hypothetical protein CHINAEXTREME_17600 [Halobiforma lacisalsi AJ5]|uniref:Uncharacterized protein n=1 Tax=Natronobacterium lacisalsi AJ5 TaxID=358396 RepID=M0LDE9_NATLA|nr:hypothetical protein [Halobiforma lacisalsi]APX00136.1 hypothetical protein CHINAEXTREME_17600 [Halobiforma lacisalsi AJ5]EMA31587.1 hypothetical protein C445_13932 [Halobiforma lacisalsi AJ5]
MVSDPPQSRRDGPNVETDALAVADQTTAHRQPRDTATDETRDDSRERTDPETDLEGDSSRGCPLCAFGGTGPDRDRDWDRDRNEDDVYKHLLVSHRKSAIVDALLTERCEAGDDDRSGSR